MHVGFEPVPGMSPSDAMPQEGWEGKLLARQERECWTHGSKMHSEAIRNAPKSPSMSILRKIGMGGDSFATKATKRRAAVLVKSTDYYKPASILAALGGKAADLGVNPGGLERSIQLETGDDFADVYVASNAEAADYAVKMHDEKGVTWKHRGPGTQAKGPQADDKFIERAWTVWREKFKAKMEELYKMAFSGWKNL